MLLYGLLQRADMLAARQYESHGLQTRLEIRGRKTHNYAEQLFTKAKDAVFYGTVEGFGFEEERGKMVNALHSGLLEDSKRLESTAPNEPARRYVGEALEKIQIAVPFSHGPANLILQGDYNQSDRPAP